MKIMIVADVHQRIKVNPLRKRRTLKAVKTAFSSVPCDLAVFLGDLVHGPDYADNRKRYVHDLKEVLNLTGNVPFAFVFGNHDDECEMTKSEILSIIGGYKNSLTNGENYVLRLNGETLLFIDSGSYYDGDESVYDIVKPETLLWAKRELEGEKAILFQHIIIPDVLKVIEKRGGKCRFKNGCGFSGRLKEHPCPPDINSGELETLAPVIKAMVFGHDHVNSFEGNLNGVKLIQCASAGVNGYEYPRRPTVTLLDTQTLSVKTIRV